MSYVAAGVLPIEEVSNKNLSLVAKEIFPYWIFVIFIIGGAVFAIATSMITAISEYVPGPCTHRPSHHGSGLYQK